MDRNRVRFVVTDAMLALLLVAFGLVGTAPAGRRQDPDIVVDGWGYALVVAAALALAVRRVWPLVTLAFVAVATSTYLVLGYPYGPILVSFLLAAFTVARYLPIRAAAVACGVALAILMVHVFVGSKPAGIVGVVPASAWVVVPFAIGATVRLGRESAARAHEEQLREKAYEERLRVAQEVHDVVGHGLAAINMQAEIALHLLPKRPEQAETALSAISRTSREALDELRATLVAVRRTGAGEARAPTPGLGRLDDLVARMSETGVPVDVHTNGEPRDVPVAVDLAAYRVVQESLTNVLRHAGAATATVRLTYAPGEVSVDVTDTGRGGVADPAGGSGPGHGIAGMRERVIALGGTFEAGPHFGGGFRVHASLPVPVEPGS